MEQGTSSFRNPASKPGGGSLPVMHSGSVPRERGVRTRFLLILATALIIAGTTLVSLLAIRRPLQNLVVRNLFSNLLHSIATFEDLQSQRLLALDRANALMADLPKLRALMTTSDQRTIQDGAVEFWKLGGNDLFALADRSGNVIAAFVNGSTVDDTLRADLKQFATGHNVAYFVSGDRLFGCSVQPLYFGSSAEGTLLGYVISGNAIDRHMVTSLSRMTSVEAAFISRGRVLASSQQSAGSIEQAAATLPESSSPFTLVLGRERFLAVARNFTPRATAPLILLEFQSLDQEEQSIHDIDRLVLLAGSLALVLGTVLMVALSRFVTQPLEQLAAGVRAFATGDSTHLLPYRGTREVRELSTAFAGMRREIIQANQALLDSERLATIGRMASSVSHDLRHYLAAVYANSEFLASGKLSEAERSEILAEVRTAVDGTTEMLESLLMFSRTNSGLRRSQQSVCALADRALNMVRKHPDAAGVAFSFDASATDDCAAFIESRQLERAIYNLLLNACQAPRHPHMPPAVDMKISAANEEIMVDVSDNGLGVPLAVRETLFDPFVSEGKHKGSGLGLTLTQSIAAEHGGSVSLLTTGQGETVFRLRIPRGHTSGQQPALGRAQSGKL
jgi:signal transduction histidine kinase